LLLFGRVAVAAAPGGFATSDTIPKTVTELWAGFEEFDKATPMEGEVLKEWEADGVVCRLVRYQVGVFKGAPSRVAAFYAFPKGGSKLPAVLEMHGGGQSASSDAVMQWARRGYAAMSLNWGGNRLNFGRSNVTLKWGGTGMNSGRSNVTYEGPQTDWGNLDATHPPQRDKINHFAGPLLPNEYTLDAVESPRNSNWFVVLTAARRAITFLQQQPEVDPARIGATGHSMGGKLTTNLAGIDKRIKAAVPSCGGSGDLLESQADLPGGLKSKVDPLKLACISDNAYIPLITCPTLWLSPTNDFHAHIDNMAWNWRNVADERLRLSIAPHLNHRHTEEHVITQHLWFEEHLKGALKLPQTPQLRLLLKQSDGVPRLSLVPDEADRVRRVDIYYSVDPHALTRFWRDAGAVRVGKQWEGSCPVMDLGEPLFAYANVVYDTPEPYRSEPGSSATFALSSRVLSAGAAQLQAAGVKATDKPERLIDDGARGWHDWYQINWGHPPLWNAYTRKIKDAKWRGPDGARLVFEIRSQTDNALVVTFLCNEWGAVAPGKPPVDYSVLKPLKGSPDWQVVSVSLEELAATDPKFTAPLANWQSACELSISPSGAVAKDGQKLKLDGKAWQGPREIRNLRWEGGEYVRAGAKAGGVDSAEHEKAFNDAIKKSLEQEKQDRKK